MSIADMMIVEGMVIMIATMTAAMDTDAIARQRILQGRRSR
ncbi:hypothetical protein [Paralcaligenes ureilyticus]|nr:hypothetical protein [Paralcaligenes ureilyticus]